MVTPTVYETRRVSPYNFRYEGEQDLPVGASFEARPRSERRVRGRRLRRGLERCRRGLRGARMRRAA